MPTLQTDTTSALEKLKAVRNFEVPFGNRSVTAKGVAAFAEEARRLQNLGMLSKDQKEFGLKK
jgi:hypothetical protein